MIFQQFILVAFTLGGISTPAVTAALHIQGGDASPVRKRTHLRHLSSNAHAHPEEHDEIYDPFIGIPSGVGLQAGSMPMSMSMPSKLRTNRVMPMPSSMSMELQAAPSFTSCPLDCGQGHICAFSSPESEPLCYPECRPSFPVFTGGDGECRSGDVCIHSTFTCGSQNDVMNEFCECNAFDSDTAGTFMCWASECSVEVKSAQLSRERL